MLDGLELTRRLRADLRTAAIPVLLLSARAGETARIEGFLAGADEYIEKPFGARELIARIAAAVRLARLRTELAQRERQSPYSRGFQRRRVGDGSKAGVR